MKIACQVGDEPGLAGLRGGGRAAAGGTRLSREVPLLAWLMAAAAVLDVAQAHAAEASPVVPAAASASDASANSAATEPARAIYQQRTPDGRVVFTDRPAASAATERRWLIDAEDPSAAAARREASKAESDKVTERIQRSIDQQRQLDNALQIQQSRAQQAADEQRARDRQRDADLDSRPIVVMPQRPWNHPPGTRHPPKLPVNPKPAPSEPMMRVGKGAPASSATN